MSGFCCCRCGEELEGYILPSNPIYRHCMCFRYFLHQLFSGYVPTFQRLEGRTSAPAGPAMADPLTSAPALITSVDDPSSDAYRLVARPLPFDSGDSRYSRSQRDGLISRRDKAIRSAGNSDVEQLGGSKKHKNAGFEEESKADCFEMERDLSSNAYATDYVLASLEDEDVCPICLEEYDPENPKIETKCAHYYHLSCMYEWMERSDSCPICGKEMEFSESL